MEEDYNKLRKNLYEMDKFVENYQAEIYSVNNETEKFQGEINVLNEKILNIENNISRLNEENEKETQNICKLNDYLKENQDNLACFNNLLNEQNIVLSLKNVEFDSVNSILAQKDKYIEDMKTEVIELLNIIAEKRSSINSYITFKNSIEKRKNQISMEKGEKNKKSSELEISALEEQQKIESYNQKCNNLEQLIDELEKNKSDFIAENKSIEKNIFELNSKIQSKQGRHRVLHEMEIEFEGYNRSVKEIMKVKEKDKALSTGICGVVADLIQVPEQYEIAIEVALGGALQDIVTEDEYVAKRYIEFLKENKYGRATFLPLSTIKGRGIPSPDNQFAHSSGFIGFANNIISNNEKYNDIISSLLGRVAVVDNIDSGIIIAKKTNYSMKIVTLDGDVINSGGAFTGGSVSSKTGKILSRKREIDQLQKDLNEHKNSLLIIVNSKNDLDKKMNTVDTQIKSSVEEKHSTKLIITSCNNNYSIIISDTQRLSMDLENLDNELIELKMEENDTCLKIEEESKLLCEFEIKSSDFSNNVEIEQSSIKDILNQKDSLVSETTAIKIKTAEHKQSIITLENKVNDISNNIMECNASISKRTDEKFKFAEECNKEHNNIKDTQNSINVLNNKNSNLKYKLDKISNDRKQSALTLEDMEQKKREYNEMSAALQGDIHKLEMQKAKLDIEMENMQNKIWDDYEISYAAALKYKRDIENLSQVGREINSLKEEIKVLGTVNIAAIDEYKKVKERFEFLLKQKSDLEEAKNSLEKVISEMTEKMKIQFIKNFAIINDNFNTIFQQLFGGGWAKLVLSDEQNVLLSGIEIIAEPPGKKLQSMTLLSGGEKAFTAIALLFAILRMKPSPFCILDEIEAALDDVNVARYARFLKELSRETQFIIVTHRKGTMEVSDALYGVTMEEKGISMLVSAKLSEKAS